jgi:hypothetical protein
MGKDISDKRLNEMLNSHQIRTTFSPYILLNALILDKHLESIKSFSISKLRQSEQRDFFQGYKLAIISTLYQYLDNVIREPTTVGIVSDLSFQDYWSYTKTTGKDKLKSVIRQNHIMSALISRVQSLFEGILKAGSWSELTEIKGNIQDFILALERIFIKSYVCRELTDSRWRSVEAYEALSKSAYEILWVELMEIKHLRRIYQEVYRDHKPKKVPETDGWGENKDQELTRFHHDPDDHLDIMLASYPPDQWVNGYAYTLFTLLVEFCQPCIQPDLIDLTKTVGNIKSWFEFDELSRGVQDILEKTPDFFNPEKKWLFKQKRPISSVDYRKLLLPVKHQSNLEQVRGILGNLIRLVDIQTPAAPLNFECLLDGAVIRGKRNGEKALIAEIKHPIDQKANEYSFAIFMPAYSRGIIPSNASTWWVYYDICNDFSGTARQILRQMQEAIHTREEYIEIIHLKLDKDEFYQLCEDPGYLYIKNEIAEIKKLDSQIRGAFPELLLQTFLSAQDAHPVKCRLKPKFLKKELDVTGVKWQSQKPLEIMIFESKGQATTYEELQNELDYFSNKIDKIKKNVPELAELLSIPYQDHIQITGIFVSMAEVTGEDVIIPDNITIWDFNRFNDELSKARIPDEYRSLLRRKILARNFSLSDPFTDVFFGRPKNNLSRPNNSENSNFPHL